MSSSTPGTSISAEVTHIDGRGLWLLVHDKEYFLSHEDFPWFREARIHSILNVQLVSPDHVHWPDLDVDLCLDSLEHPEAYPLVYH